MRRSKRGVTLIETLVAMLILALCIMGVMSLWGFSMTLSQRSEIGRAHV